MLGSLGRSVLSLSIAPRANPTFPEIAGILPINEEVCVPCLTALYECHASSLFLSLAASDESAIERQDAPLGVQWSSSFG